MSSHKRKCDNLKDPSHLLDFKVPLSIDIFFGQPTGTKMRVEFHIDLKTPCVMLAQSTLLHIIQRFLSKQK